MYAGIDAGASATKATLVDKEEKIISYSIVPSGINFEASSRDALGKALERSNLCREDLKCTVSTGYGRALVKADAISSEIMCTARGVHRLFPSVRTIIDVGGQDSKAIRTAHDGKVLDFAMNDKCAAGTGRFLEAMANTLAKPIELLGELHFESTQSVKISSTCTVFAESEVISRMSEGCKVEDVIAGLHEAIAERIYIMSSRIGIEKDIALTGGVAKNQGFVSALSKKLDVKPILPDEPQIVCAYGAALAAMKKADNP